jgi:mannose-6-phosphate isomerase-like protein (cupin superfamily)
MRSYKLNEMVKGWFVGNFEPTIIKTNDVEVAVKNYNKGESEPSHHHRVATEITVVVSGSILMNGKKFIAGDIVVLEPYESTNFEVLENGTINVVVKFPGASNDKYVD